MSLLRGKPWEVGCDEAGRGALAGPVVAAAVLLPAGYAISGINDSKQLTATARTLLAKVIRKRAYYAIGMADSAEIDEINILNATFLAMHRALQALSVAFRLILVDGNRFRPYANVPHKCVVRGDSRHESIAAASILAKTHRDEWMKRAALTHSNYGWPQNKGYPTRQHKAAIYKHGLTCIHRKTFNYQGKI